MDDDLLALPTRRRLYEAVRRSPGLGAREAQRAAGAGWGETVYHLDRLTEANLLHRESSGHQDHYFVAAVPLADRGLIRLARSRSARRLLVALLEAPGSTVPELAERTGLSAGRLSVHLGRLVETAVVRTGRRARLRTFDLVDRDRVLRLLVSYRESLADEWVERLLETWSDLLRP
ncbi:MAG TPA: winged helix-turn-helix transcriptional regulator [Thermoplasmata archaeon]|nr:winged helix-turn-helix transcriptional regulator [Thermoplasmata archaeon]